MDVWGIVLIAALAWLTLSVLLAVIFGRIAKRGDSEELNATASAVLKDTEVGGNAAA